MDVTLDGEGLWPSRSQRGHSVLLCACLLVWFDAAATCRRALHLLEREAAKVLRLNGLILGLPAHHQCHVVRWDSGPLNHGVSFRTRQHRGMWRQDLARHRCRVPDGLLPTLDSGIVDARCPCISAVPPALMNEIGSSTAWHTRSARGFPGSTFGGRVSTARDRPSWG